MQFPNSISVTDQEIDISFLTEKQRAYYIQLADTLRTQYQEHKRERQVYFLSGPGGAGKSVVAAMLNHIFRSESSFQFVFCGIDAFHYTNKDLMRMGLKEVKGRYDTYDIDKIVTTLKSFKAGEEVMLPRYSRELHEPIFDGTYVTQENVLLLLEGGWLLSKIHGWDQLLPFTDFTMALSAPTEDLKQNITKRHIAGGRTENDAERFYEESDQKNTEMIQKYSIKPDLELQYFENIC